jgi:hypothetical protein
MANYIPKKRDHVRVQGQSGVFTVLTVHKKRKRADLQLTGKVPVKNVPFGVIRPIYESEAAVSQSKSEQQREP